MPKITFIGAGSTVFAQNLLGDILSFPELADSTINLHDIDEERLRTTEIVAQKIAERLEINPTIEASLDRREALDGADYAISMFQVGGYKPATVTDFEIPKKYGLRQTINLLSQWLSSNAPRAAAVRASSRARRASSNCPSQ